MFFFFFFASSPLLFPFTVYLILRILIYSHCFDLRHLSSQQFSTCPPDSFKLILNISATRISSSTFSLLSISFPLFSPLHTSFYVLFFFSFLIFLYALSPPLTRFTRKSNEYLFYSFISIRVVRLRFSFRFLGLLLVHFDTRIHACTHRSVFILRCERVSHRRSSETVTRPAQARLLVRLPLNTNVSIGQLT